MLTTLSVLLPLAFAGDDAAPKPSFPVVKPGGVLFGHWALDLGDTAEAYNEFAIDRVYVRADATLSDTFSTRVTLDADRLKPVDVAGAETILDTKYRVFVKHAYLEAKLVKGLKLRAGMIDTPYTPFYDNFWGNRYITESFAKNQKVLETADLGVGLWGDHAKGLVNWNVSLLNGEGYGKLEVDAAKAVQGRLTVDPLAANGKLGLPISGFVSYSGDATDQTPVLTWIGAVGAKTPYGVVWAEVLGTSEDGTSGFGYSGTLNPRIPDILGVVVRYDHFDPDTATDDDGNTLLIAGLTHDFLDKVSVSATYERAWDDATPDAPDQLAALRFQAGF